MNPRSILSNFWGSLQFDTPSCFCEQNAKTIQDYSGKKDGKNKKNAYLCRIFQ